MHGAAGDSSFLRLKYRKSETGVAEQGVYGEHTQERSASRSPSQKLARPRDGLFLYCNPGAVTSRTRRTRNYVRRLFALSETNQQVTSRAAEFAGKVEITVCAYWTANNFSYFRGSNANSPHASREAAKPTPFAVIFPQNRTRRPTD